MVKLRRGFVKEANEYASEFREELNLDSKDPICPFRLCQHLEIPVIGLSKHPAIPHDVKTYFGGQGQNDFSATTLVDGGFKEIIHNDYHHPNRQNSNVVHELAHILLGHEARPPMLKDGCRNIDKVIEHEANELGWVILVPKTAAMKALEEFDTLSDAAIFYSVSLQLMTYRVRKSGAMGWYKNKSKYRR